MTAEVLKCNSCSKRKWQVNESTLQFNMRVRESESRSIFAFLIPDFPSEHIFTLLPYSPYSPTARSQTCVRPRMEMPRKPRTFSLFPFSMSSAFEE